MIAISFVLNEGALRSVTDIEIAHHDLTRVLSQHGFSHQQGNLYFGNEEVDAVHCVLAVQTLCREFRWFPATVSKIRMLRIEGNSDLTPAVVSAVS